MILFRRQSRYLEWRFRGHGRGTCHFPSFRIDKTGHPMPNIVKTMLAVLMVPLCFAIGMYAGPHAASAYHKVFPEPEYKTGDFSALYAKAGHEVVMYSSSTCPYCAKVRELFVKQGVKFTEYQVDKSKVAAAEFKQRGGLYVPLLYIGEREIAGFREQAIRDAISAIDKKS
jgi:glutaredoxin